MPRRVYTYPAELGWGNINLFISAGAVLFFLSFVLFTFNLAHGALKGALAGNNPWDAGTLEWATSSPPPSYNFARIPIVTHGEPLWAEREALPVATGLRVDVRELLISTVAEAHPDIREKSATPSIWPLLAAIAVGGTFVYSIFTPWAVVWGAAPIAITLIGWFWPKGDPEDEE
jgi:cytochrome c oxidase subunit 1